MNFSSFDESAPGSFIAKVTFSEAVTDFVDTELTATNASVGTLTPTGGSGTEFTAEVTPDGTGNVALNVAADVAQDAAANGNTAGSEVIIFQIEDVAPTVDILDAPETIEDLTPFSIRVVFSEEVTGFELADVSVGNGEASNFTSLNNTTFAVDITPDGSGDVTLDVLAGVAQDLSGNDNLAATQVVIENRIVDITKQVIANFLLGNQPDLSSMLRGTHGNGGGTLGNLALSGNENGMDLAFATSLSKIDRERQHAIDQRVSEAHKFANSAVSGGSPADTYGAGIYGADIIRGGVEDASIIVPTNEDFSGFGTVPTRRYDIWTEVYGATSTSGDNDSSYWVGYLGGHYFVSDDFLVGGLVQLDWSEEEDNTAGSSADGFGWMVGPYMAGRVPNSNLSFDLRAAWGRSNNTVTPIGIYTDDFETERWLVSGKVQGSYAFDDFIIKPTLQASWFEETQQAYIDRLGNEISAQKISLGELRFGPEFSMNKVLENGMVFSPSIEISGVWNFGIDDNAASQGYVLGDDDIRARVDIGIDLVDDQGRSLAVSGYYDGLGVEDYEAMGGEIRLSIPIQ